MNETITMIDFVWYYFFLYLPFVGIVLAITGSIISIIGVFYNNQKHQHRTAMNIWKFSNAILAVWAFGYFMGFWNSYLSAGFLCVMYSIYTVSNWHGLVKYRKSGCGNVRGEKEN